MERNDPRVHSLKEFAYLGDFTHAWNKHKRVSGITFQCPHSKYSDMTEERNTHPLALEIVDTARRRFPDNVNWIKLLIKLKNLRRKIS